MSLCKCGGIAGSPRDCFQVSLYSYHFRLCGWFCNGGSKTLAAYIYWVADLWRSWLKNCTKIKSSLFLCFFYTDYFLAVSWNKPKKGNYITLRALFTNMLSGKKTTVSFDVTVCRTLCFSKQISTIWSRQESDFHENQWGVESTKGTTVTTVTVTSHCFPLSTSAHLFSADQLQQIGFFFFLGKGQETTFNSE